MELFYHFADNLILPPLLFFLFGILAGIVKSDLIIPEQISKYFVLYLISAIGFKGGAAIAQTANINKQAILTILAGTSSGFIQPFIGYFFLKKTTGLDSHTAAALAGHYGSISMVTFVTAISFLEMNSISYQNYILAVLALMEVPAIFSSLLIAYGNKKNSLGNKEIGKLLHKITTHNSLFLLIGTFIIGLISGTRGMQQMSGFLVAPFQGILAFFLLDMGLTVSKRLGDLKEFSVRLIMFGIYMPLLSAFIGLILSYSLGLDVGTGFLFITLIASASYIVVTAVMRSALPEAKAAIYLPMSLAITFPFNITLGIPFYFTLAKRFLG